MVLGKKSGKRKSVRFTCEYEDCRSLCCKENLVVLNEDDVKALKIKNVDIEASTSQMELNDFLNWLGTKPIKQLQGLKVLKLKHDTGGNCLYLNSESGNCQIYNDRPYHCREFPFKISRGKIKIHNSICPGIDKGEDLDSSSLSEVLGLNEAELQPPFLLGPEDKLKLARVLMSAGFRVFRFIK